MDNSIEDGPGNRTGVKPPTAKTVMDFSGLHEKIRQTFCVAPSARRVLPSTILEETERLLDRGVDPNLMIDGHTLLGLLGTLCRGGSQLAEDMATLLIERGANPMGYDRPLGHSIQHQWSSALLMAVIEAMSQRETKGRGLRDALGGTVLHYYAEVDPKTAEELLTEDLDGYLNTDPGGVGAGKPYFPLSMINLARDDGATALHVLWAGARERPHASLWDMTEALLARGGDLAKQDAKGMSVAELIWKSTEDVSSEDGAGREHLAGLLRHHENTWNRVLALVSLKQLKAETLPAGKPDHGAKMSLRL